MQPREDGVDTWKRCSWHSSPQLLLMDRLYSPSAAERVTCQAATGKAQSEVQPLSFPGKEGGNWIGEVGAGALTVEKSRTWSGTRTRPWLRGCWSDSGHQLLKWQPPKMLPPGLSAAEAQKPPPF